MKISTLKTAGGETIVPRTMAEVVSYDENKSVKDVLLEKVDKSELESLYAYGIRFSQSVSNPNSVTRIGNMSLHRTLPVHNKMKGCLVNNDGSINRYLPDGSWENEVRDGSQGYVMVSLPIGCYYKIVVSGDSFEYWVSEYPLEGYTQYKTVYVSAYEAAINRSNNTLCSVVNTSTTYRGGNNTSAWDGTYRSLLGRPVTKISITNCRTYARNNGNNWSLGDAYVQKHLYWLYVVEYATLDSQKAYNPSLTVEGYRQGGLGAGVSNLDGTRWNNFNGYNPFILCGYTDEYGNNTGVKAYTMPSEYGTLTTSVPRYRGIENPFGHIWKWTDGYYAINDTTRQVTDLYYCEDIQYYASVLDTTHWTKIGEASWNKEGFFSKVILTDGHILASKGNESNGSATTYYCDYNWYINVPSSGTAIKSFLFGGYAASGARGGFACAVAADAPTSAAAHYGCRLCCHKI